VADPLNPLLTNTELPMFRFTIRDVLWVMTFIAVSLTWWADRARMTADHVKVVKERQRWLWAFNSLATMIRSDGYEVSVVTPETYMVNVPNADPTNASFVRDAVYVRSPNGSQSLMQKSDDLRVRSKKHHLTRIEPAPLNDP
jgi:hypothetical protein